MMETDLFLFQKRKIGLQKLIHRHTTQQMQMRKTKWAHFHEII